MPGSKHESARSRALFLLPRQNLKEPKIRSDPWNKLQKFGGLEFPGLKRLVRSQNSQFPGVLANGMTSRIFAMPVTNMRRRSNPSPKPACGTLPYFRRSTYH